MKAQRPTKAHRSVSTASLIALMLLLSGVTAVAALAAPEATKKENSGQAPVTQVPPENTPVAWGPYTVHTTVEVGYRWKSSAGSEDVYRSQVNLGRGPRLLSSTVYMEAAPGTGILWDRIQLNVDNWGGDPYNTVRFRAEKAEIYQFDFHYQNIQYFNAIPTFANPLLADGLQISQHKRDSGRHLFEARLTLWPSARVHPYLSYSKSRALGRGRTTYAAPGDEFTIFTGLRENSDEYRGGIEFGRHRFGGFVEQAYRRTKEDWRLTDIKSLHEGNSAGSVLGTNISLDDLLRNDHARGKAYISRAFLRWIPRDSLQLSGQATFVNADQSFEQDQSSSGSFLSFTDRQIFPSERSGVRSRSQLPGLLLGGSVLYRPSKRFSLVDSIHIYQFHSDGDAISSRTLFDAIPLSGNPDPETISLVEPLNGRIAFNTRRNTLDGTVQLNSMVSLRLGYRYQRQEARLRTRESLFGERTTRVDSNQHMPLVGLDLLLFSGLKLSAEFEKGYTDRVLYRTMPKDFTRLRVRARTQWTQKIRFSGFLNLFDHRNGVDGVDLTGHRRGFGFNVSVNPVERISLSLEYQRSDVDSNIQTLIPQTLTRSRSLYIENSNYGSAHLELGLPRKVLLTLGYSVTGTTGSFPINFHQPYTSLEIPLNRRVTWKWSWRFYGYNEKLESIEDYRTHLYSSSLAFHF